MPDAQAVFSDLVCEFLEALVHQILYIRRLYDRDIFQKERLYGIAVQKSRHPDLNSYISESVLSLKDAIQLGAVKKVGISISSPAGQIQERHIFSMEVLELGELDLRHLEPILRAMLLKLQYTDSCVKSLPPGCTFEIESHVLNEDSLPIHLWVDGSSAASKDRDLRFVLPIKSGAVGAAVKLQLHTETC